MAARADAITARVIRAYCITHKVGFDAPSNKPILCESGGHALARNFPDSSSWEYCCDCQHYWLVDTGKKEAGSKECPACERNVVRRYVCADCNVISVESDEPGRRKIFAITNGIPTPTCPGCLQEPAQSAIEHDCRDYGAPFVTSFSTCPFCDEVLERLPDFPSTVSECLASLRTTPTELRFDSRANQLTASADGDYLLLPRVPGLKLSFAIPKVRKLKSKGEYYDTYYELFNCDNPSAGEIIVVRPASVDRTETGWIVKEAGAIEIKLAGPQRITQDLIVCPNCGTAGKPAEQFCGRCGLALGGFAASGSESINPPAELSAPENEPIFASVPTASFVGAVENVTASPIDATSWPAPSTARIPSPMSTAAKVLLAGIGLVLLLVVIIAVSLNTVGSNTVEKQLDDAIATNNLFPPASQNAYQLYNQLKANGASEDKLSKYRERLLPLLTGNPYQLIADLPTIGGEEPTTEQWLDAAKNLNWAIELKPGDKKVAARAAYCEGRAAFVQRQNESALSSWNRATSLDPSWALPVNGIGLIYQGRRDYPTSRSYFLRAVNLDPNWAHPYENLGNNYFYERDYATARDYYQKALEKAPNWAKPHWHLGQVAMQFNDYSTAVNELEAALSPDAKGLKGNEASTVQKDLDRARRKLSETSPMSSY